MRLLESIRGCNDVNDPPQTTTFSDERKRRYFPKLLNAKLMERLCSLITEIPMLSSRWKVLRSARTVYLIYLHIGPKRSYSVYPRN